MGLDDVALRDYHMQPSVLDGVHLIFPQIPNIVELVTLVSMMST